MADIGTTLREARMRARIDITEVEARTKIRAKYLRALENEEWDLLPGSVFVKSFLKTYGDFLGLDSRLLVDEFKRRYERPSDHEPRPVAGLSTRERDQRRRIRRPVLSPGLLIGVVIVLIVAVLVVIGEIGKNPKTTSGNSNHGTQSHRVGGHHAHANTNTTVTTKPPKPSRVRLQITPIGSGVYVCAQAASGKILIPGVTYSQGEAVPVTRARAILVTFGNDQAQLKINGKPYKLHPSATPIGLKITPTSVKPLSSGPTCTG